MGRFVNPDNSAFQVILNSDIYVDKTELLAYTNKALNTDRAMICNSRPRRFGKSITANMLTAYYSRGCDSDAMFADLAISKTESYKKHLNKYDVIHLDIQWCSMDAGSTKQTVTYINTNVIRELKEMYPDYIPDSVTTVYGALSYINSCSGKKFIVIIDEWDAARVHGAITNTGGIAPNVIPAEAQILYAIRAPKVTQVKKLYERMCDIAKGAALITGTTVDIRQVAAYSNVIGNDVLEEVMDKNLDHFIPIGYTEEELAYAGKFKEVVTELDKEGLKDMIAHVVEKDKRKEVLDMPLLDFKLDRSESYGGGGSTDVGDVSWVVPTVQTNVCCYAAGTALHSWQAVAQGKASIAHKGMLTAAKVMACTGADLLENPELIKKAHKDWLEELDGETYPNPLPPEVKPGLW